MSGMRRSGFMASLSASPRRTPISRCISSSSASSAACSAADRSDATAGRVSVGASIGGNGPREHIFTTHSQPLCVQVGVSRSCLNKNNDPRK